MVKLARYEGDTKTKNISGYSVQLTDELKMGSPLPIQDDVFTAFACKSCSSEPIISTSINSPGFTFFALLMYSHMFSYLPGEAHGADFFLYRHEASAPFFFYLFWNMAG